MLDLEITDHLDQQDVVEVEQLLERVRVADGHKPIDEQRWVDAANGGRVDFAGLLLRERGHDHPIAYAQVTKGTKTWAIDLVIDPHHRYDAMAIGPRLLGEAATLIRSAGGGHVHHWVYEPNAAHTAMAATIGLTPGRDLLQMRVPLPLGETTDLVTRSFVVGEDEQEWLDVNNAAFDWHPEQGGWTIEDLHSREAEPWFDPDGFLIHDHDGRMAGFCWTKVHTDVDPPIGEIYVIAAHPDHHGKGLGRALTVAGLRSLADRGLGAAMLYVDAENRPAVALYEKLGFTVHHVDRAFVGDIT